MIAFGRDELLRVVPHAPDRDRVDDPVAIALKNIARAARAAVVLRMRPAPRSRRIRGERRSKAH
jgi:hypothetical protein